MKLKRKILTWFFDRWYLYRPPEMVSWWKRSGSMPAKVTATPEGHAIMYIKGEKYPFPAFPRGHLLFGKLSKLKHEIKNQIFNWAWAKLENNERFLGELKGEVLDRILALSEESRFDRLPYAKLLPAVKELHNGFTKAAEGHPQQQKLEQFRDMLCYVLQEDDSYRWRVQWLVNFFHPNRPFTDPVKNLEESLEMLEHAEVVDDMKERIRLLRRVLIAILKDKGINELFKKFCKHVNWKKIKLSKIEKYYFRGKYFKVDYDKFNY